MIFLYYIQETDKPNILLKKANIIKLREDKIILPIAEEPINIKKAEKLAIKTKNILEKTNCKKVVLSKKIKKQEEYIDFLNSYGIQVTNGNKLFKVLMVKILQYIIEKTKLKEDEIQISILVNDVEANVLENIKRIVKKYKKVNIVTNHFEKFKKLEEQIFGEDGIMLTVSNNKRKSLFNSQVILNIDFPEELINKYRIYEKAIIVNFRRNVTIDAKRFNGMNIKDYEIDFQYLEAFDLEKENLYDKKDIYEAEILKNKPYEVVMKNLIRNKVKIVKLIGNNNIL